MADWILKRAWGTSSFYRDFGGNYRFGHSHLEG